MKLVILTGLSGAGKTTAIKAMENMGFFCVDNLPASLLTKLADLCFEGKTEFDKVAVGIDVRGRSFFNELGKAFEYMDEKGYPVEIVFLTCDREALVNRYNFTRYTHPLAEECGTVLECINTEKNVLAEIKERATVLIDTTRMQPKNLKETLLRTFGESECQQVRICSFGFKRGVPVDADYIFDARFLPNPYNVPELRRDSGLTPQIKEYLGGFEEFDKTVSMLLDQLKFIIPQYHGSGKNELLYAIGCTGGYHRSVAVAEALSKGLREAGFSVVCEHRDLDKEGEKWKDPSQH